ncbi:hypothetical protein H000_01542 [Escherichia coli UMEA 3899-1]|nr:hypothetical protein H000_01542 [Escherichia coli UMEA 3899-1]
MDTTEERNGTYFYRGHPNLSKIELLNVIFLEEFCKELGIDSVSGAAILSGQPWLGTRAKPQGATLGTSVVSKYARILMRDARMLNRPGFPGECFICELRLPDHRFRWKHNKLFLLLPEEYGPAFPAIVDCYTSPPT